MKKFILGCFVLIALVANASGPSQKTLDAFHNTFQQVKEVKWHDVANGCEAVFSENNISYRVVYDNDGNIVQSFRYYSQKELPLLVLSKIHKKYQSLQVTGVVERTEMEEISYDVTLEDERNLIVVHVDGRGVIESTKKLRK